MPYGYAGDLTPAEAWAMLESTPNAELVDVRTNAEWAFVGRPDLGSVGRQLRLVSWINFPTGQPNGNFAQQLMDQGLQEDTPLLFICRSGQRSAAAATAMTQMGFKTCYNVSEGFEGDHDHLRHRGSTGGWKVAGLPWVQD